VFEIAFRVVEAVVNGDKKLCAHDDSSSDGMSRCHSCLDIAERLPRLEPCAIDREEGSVERSVGASQIPEAAVPKSVATMDDPLAIANDHPGDLRLIETIHSGNREHGEIAEGERLIRADGVGAKPLRSDRRSFRVESHDCEAAAFSHRLDRRWIEVVVVQVSNEYVAALGLDRDRVDGFLPRRTQRRRLDPRVEQDGDVSGAELYPCPSQPLHFQRRLEDFGCLVPQGEWRDSSQRECASSFQ